MNLSKEQRDIIESTEPYILVDASSGAGKTLCLVEKFRKMRQSGIDPTKMVAITFTNNAADEMRQRLGKDADGAYIGTIHSYANYILSCAGINTYELLEHEDFDGLFKLVKENPTCVLDIDYLSCDEAQDQTAEQYDLILNYLKPKQWLMVGDIKQSIYLWSSASPDEFCKLKKDPSVKVYYLRNNYRCGSNILNFARSIIHSAGDQYEDNSISMAPYTGNVHDVEYNANKLANGIKEWTTKYDQEWKDWFVLCRTNQELEYFYSILQAKGIPCDTFKRKDLSREGLNEKLNENTIKVLTIHASKGLEARNVAVIGGRFYSTEERCVSYVAATRAKEFLLWTRPACGKRKYQQNTVEANVYNWE